MTHENRLRNQGKCARPGYGWENIRKVDSPRLLLPLRRGIPLVRPVRTGTACLLPKSKENRINFSGIDWQSEIARRRSDGAHCRQKEKRQLREKIQLRWQ